MRRAAVRVSVEMETPRPTAVSQGTVLSCRRELPTVHCRRSQAEVRLSFVDQMF